MSDTREREPLVTPALPPEVPRRLIRVGSSTSTHAQPLTSTSNPSPAPNEPCLPFVQPAVREIHKNAWLKRLTPNERKGGPFVKKFEKFWVVFCVHDDVEAFLEFYSEPKMIVGHKPLNALSLNTCLHVSPSIMGQENKEYEFAVTLPSQVVRLIAQNWDQMIEWVESLQGKLREMNVMSPKDNLYSKLPETNKNQVSSTRDPNSPLPPPPHGVDALLRITPRGSLTEESSLLQSDDPLPDQTRPLLNRQTPPEVALRPPLQTQTEPPEATFISTSRPPSMRRPPEPSSSSSSSSSGVSSASAVSSIVSEMSSSSGDSVTSSIIGNKIQRSRPPRPPIRRSSSSENVYEHLYVPEGQGRSRGTKSRQCRIPVSTQGGNKDRSSREETPPPPTIPGRNPIPKRLQSGGNAGRSSSLSRLSEPSRSSSRGRGDPSRRAQPPPLPSGVELGERLIGNSRFYQGREGVSTQGEPMEGMIGVRSGEYRIRRDESHLSMGRMEGEGIPAGPTLPLKEQQVLILQTEINHPVGVRVALRKKDCVNTIAFVDYLGAVWIAGWKQRQNPVLYYAFHVGDQVLKVAGVTVHTSVEAIRAIRMVSSMQVELIIRRLPYGRVFVIKRSVEGEPLGLVAEGSSGEISEVLSTGLAHRQGLPPTGPGINGGNATSNWYLTEINNRPLSLFSRGNEVKERLNAVGKEISILVQPADLVKHLKKGLKAHRGFKDYVVG